MSNEKHPQEPKGQHKSSAVNKAAADRRAEKEFQPHMAADYILNTILRDYLRNNVPPDFTSRILGRIKARNIGIGEPAPTSYPPPSYSSDHLDEALGAAMADIDFGTSSSLHDSLEHANSESTAGHVVTKRQRTKPYEVPPIIRVEPRLWDYKRYRWGSLAAALAASTIGGYLALRQPSSVNQLPETVAVTVPREPESSSASPTASAVVAPSKSQTNPSPATGVHSNNSTIAVAPPANNPPTVAPPTRVASALPKVEEDVSSTQIAASEVFTKAQPLPPPDLKTVIDSQIAMIWEQAKFPKAKRVADAQWLERLTQTAVGRASTAAEQEAFRADKSEHRERNAVAALVDSKEFALHWGRLLGEHYLGSNIASTKSQPSQTQQFIAWIQDGLEKKVPISLIESEISFPGIDSGDRTARLWFNETINREILTARDREQNSKLSYKYDNVDAPIVNLTSTLLHRSGFTSASCIQCHSSETSALDFVAAESQLSPKQFWSMSAYVMQQAARNGLHSANQLNELFYQEDNGRMTVASPKLSIDVSGKNRIVDLKEWFSSNATARSGLVELIWKNTFYQPLVPTFGLDASEALEERDDLKILLAGQLQATGSLQHLVSTILLTDAIKTPDAAVTTRWYLRASDDVLNAYHRRARLFSFVPAPARNSDAIRQSRNGEMIAWLQGVKSAQSHSQLAQPDNSAAKATTPKINSPFLQESAPKLAELQSSQLLYALSVSKPYSKLHDYAQRVSKSNLQWQDQVHHAYWLSQGRMANSLDLSQANEVYSQNGQDSNKSLIEILVGLTGSY